MFMDILKKKKKSLARKQGEPCNLFNTCTPGDVQKVLLQKCASPAGHWDNILCFVFYQFGCDNIDSESKPVSSLIFAEKSRETLNTKCHSSVS